MRRAALAAVATATLVVCACGDDTDRATRQRPAPPPAPTPPAPVPPPPPGFDAAPPVEPLTPLPTQLDAHVPAVQFLGWTEDGRRFAVRATHGYDMEELGGQNLLALVQIHDALTGAMVESFQIERIADDSVTDDDELSRAWSEAKPAAQWKAFRADNRLVGRDAETAHGEWSLEAIPVDTPPYGSRLEVNADETRLVIRWSEFDEERLQGPRRRPAPAPRVRIEVVRGTERHRLATLRAPWSYDQVNAARDGDDPVVTSTVRGFWSPTGDRIVLLATHRVRGAHEEHGELVDARWFVRVVGPQPP